MATLLCHSHISLIYYTPSPRFLLVFNRYNPVLLFGAQGRRAGKPGLLQTIFTVMHYGSIFLYQILTSFQRLFNLTLPDEWYKMWSMVLRYWY